MNKRSLMMSLIPAENAPEDVCLYFENSPDGVFRLNRKVYLKAGNEFLVCDDSDEGNEIISALRKRTAHPSEASLPEKDEWYHILTETDPELIRDFARKYGIEELKKRTVIVFRSKNRSGQDLYTFFNDITPMEEGDHPVDLGQGMLALVRDSAFSNEDEISEYAAAVIDTMASEGYPDLQAGIGTEAGSIFELHRSCREARQALRTGALHHPEKTLFRFSGQKLERIIDEIPPESRNRIVESYRTNCSEKTFDDEMMETVQVFFDHDLNITSASRQLFIHRNTLNYRLDKIRRDTGLDLRSFQDAAVFRLILGMIERENNRNNR